MTRTHKILCGVAACLLLPGGFLIGAAWLLMRKRERNRVAVERPKLRIVK